MENFFPFYTIGQHSAWHCHNPNPRAPVSKRKGTCICMPNKPLIRSYFHSNHMQVSYGNYRCLCIVVTKLNKESYQCYKNAYDLVDAHLLTLEKKVTPCENNLGRAYI